MIDEFKRIFLAGVGSAAYTYEKFSEVVDELVKKGEITMEQGKDLSEELKRSVKDTGERIKPITKPELHSILEEINLYIKRDIDEIKFRLNRIEEHLGIKIEDEDEEHSTADAGGE